MNYNVHKCNIARSVEHGELYRTLLLNPSLFTIIFLCSLPAKVAYLHASCFLMVCADAGKLTNVHPI